MESRLLNFPDAMKLASIVTKYFDTVSIPEMSGTEFAYGLFSQLTPEEVEEIVFMFGGHISMEEENIIVFCTKGMIKNSLLDLLATYKQIGFGK